METLRRKAGSLSNKSDTFCYIDGSVAMIQFIATFLFVSPFIKVKPQTFVCRREHNDVGNVGYYYGYQYQASPK